MANEKWTDNACLVPDNQCGNCARFSSKTWNCAAFDVIPDNILTDAFDHRRPHEGDGGIRFSPIKKANR